MSLTIIEVPRWEEFDPYRSWSFNVDTPWDKLIRSGVIKFGEHSIYTERPDGSIYKLTDSPYYLYDNLLELIEDGCEPHIAFEIVSL